MLNQDRQPLTGGWFKGYLSDYGGMLTGGWFFPKQAADGITVYRGQDGDIDYDHPVALMAIDDDELSLAGQELPANTVWHYVRRAVKKCCGLESVDSDFCRVRVGTNGGMILNAPNPPLDLTADLLSGGRIRLRWFYSAAGQEVAPTGFNIYMTESALSLEALNESRRPLTMGWFPQDYDHAWPLTGGWFVSTGGDEVDYSIPADTVYFAEGPWGREIAGGMGGMLGKKSYEWTSDLLTDGQLYRFAVRSFNKNFGESQNADYVTVVADSIGPAAITGITASWEAE